MADGKNKMKPEDKAIYREENATPLSKDLNNLVELLQMNLVILILHLISIIK